MLELSVPGYRQLSRICRIRRRPHCRYWSDSHDSSVGIKSPVTYQLTYIQVTYIQVTYIQVTYIQVTYIQLTYVQATYIQVTYIQVTYIQLTYINTTASTLSYYVSTTILGQQPPAGYLVIIAERYCSVFRTDLTGRE